MVSEAFQLQLVSVGILPDRPAVLPVLAGKALHHAGLVIPRQIDGAAHAALLSLDLKALLKIAAHRDRQVEMAEGALSKRHLDIPAIGAEALPQTRADAYHFAAQEPGGVHK